MKKLLCYMVAFMMCLFVSGCDNKDEIENFVDDNIACFSENEDYIMVNELQKKYTTYTEFGEFYIGEVDNVRCYAEISLVKFDEEYVNRISFKFKDSKEKKLEDVTKNINEICQTRYSGTLNGKYNVGADSAFETCISIKLNDDVHDQLYAELSGITVEEYRKDLEKVMEETIRKSTSNNYTNYSVNWEICNKIFKEELINKNVFPYVNDVYAKVDESSKQITLTAVVSDSTSPEVALDFADTMIRRFNSIAQMQDSKIKSAGNEYYGGIYDDYNLLIGVAPVSKMSDTKHWFVYDAISKGMHARQSPDLQKQYK